jgi:F0F1-type ATP synthase assembly protein I
LIKKSLFLALQIASQLAYMVMIPLVIFGGLGLLADRQFGTLPFYLLIGIAVSFIITILWIYKHFRQISQADQE